MEALKVKRKTINWYQLLYQTNDKALISFFWKWYNIHKVKSKNRAARSVLIKYYSTITAPDFVQRAFSFYRDCEVVRYGLY